MVNEVNGVARLVVHPALMGNLGLTSHPNDEVDNRGQKQKAVAEKKKRDNCGVRGVESSGAKGRKRNEEKEGAE